MKKEPTLDQLISGYKRGPQPVKEDFSLLEEQKRIRSLADIPNIWTMEIKPVEMIVDFIAARKDMTLWVGTDGTAKTFLAQSMAIAVGTGGEFLGKRCRKSPVLYCDYENADFQVRDRLELMSSGPVDNVHFGECGAIPSRHQSAVMSC